MRSGWYGLLVLVMVLAGCGGGRECESYGGLDLYYGNAAPASGQPVVVEYELGKAQTWELQTLNISKGCLKDLVVEAIIDTASTSPLPSGITLERSTGTLRTAGLQRHVEGWCGWVGSESVNRKCLNGAQFVDKGSTLEFRSAYIPGSRRMLVFRPKP